jgi:hypothetical protein
MIDEKLIEDSWNKYQAMNPAATPEQFAKECSDVVTDFLMADTKTLLKAIEEDIQNPADKWGKP